jgi:uncharacterized protein
MSLKEQIEKELMEAMKAREEVRLGVLRLLKSELQYEMTKTGARDLSDEDVIVVIRRSIKKRKESVEQFQKAGREDLATKESEEAKILEKYIPAGVSEEAMIQVIDEVIASGAANVGAAMGKVMARFKGQIVDGARVKELVSKRFQA